MLILTSSDDNDSKDGFTEVAEMRSGSTDGSYDSEEQAYDSPKNMQLETNSVMSAKRTYYSEFDDDEAGEFSKRPRFGDAEKPTASFSTEEEGYDTPKDTQYEHKKREEASTFDPTDVGYRLLKKMGYKEGKGLGIHNQGRLEPVEAAKQQGRRGLGHDIPELTEASIKYNPDEEKVTVKEEIIWLANNHTDIPTLQEMKEWTVTGPRKKTIHNETTFCSGHIVTQVVNSKAILDNLSKVDKLRARTRSNPFETIRGAFFLNRAAVKMANIDRACDFMFTKPNGLQDNELLYFADVCAGPGGFSEYVLWRKKWHAKGFGFTLIGQNDFKLDDFYAAPCETFHPLYGPKENGDVFDPANQEDLRRYVMKHTKNVGVHFMMSDGGFSVEGEENIQEILSKQLYLCQCLVALMIVRTGGHFVTKLFDLFTPFSAGLVYLMYRCFDEVSIFKPNSSRPANSERYLICKGKRGDTTDVMDYLNQINHRLLKLKDSNEDILELVSLEEMEAEKSFIEYLRASNESLGRNQITGLLKIAAYCKDTTLIERRQADIRKQCLEYWDIPDTTRVAPRSGKPQERIRQWFNDPKMLFNATARKLTADNVKSTIVNQLLDWYCVPCGSGEYLGDENKLATFYMGMGRSKVYRYVKGDWYSVSDIKVDLPPDTLVYAEVVYEQKRERSRLQKTLALHILDAYVLGGENINKKYILERNTLINKFCEALWKPQRKDYGLVRARELYPVDINIDKHLHITQRILKNNCPAFTYTMRRSYLDDDDDQDMLYIIPRSVLFFKSTAHPWTRHYTRKHKCTYVFHPKKKEGIYEKDRSSDAEASFVETFQNRFIWHWPQDESLTMDNFARHIKEQWLKIGINNND